MKTDESLSVIWLMMWRSHLNHAKTIWHKNWAWNALLQNLCSCWLTSRHKIMSVCFRVFSRSFGKIQNLHVTAFYFQNSSRHWRGRDLMTFSGFKNNCRLHLMNWKHRTSANVSNNGEKAKLTAPSHNGMTVERQLFKSWLPELSINWINMSAKQTSLFDFFKRFALENVNL